MTDRGKKRQKGKYKNWDILRMKRVFFCKIKALSFGKMYKNKGHKL